MKCLILMATLFALLGCEGNFSGVPGDAKVVAQPEMAAPSYLNEPLKGKINQRGLYKLVRSGGLIDDPSTSTGKAVSKPVIQLVESTGRIPLIKGAQMYLQYRIWSLPDLPAYVDLRRVLKHPDMTLPDGRVSTGSDYTIKGKVSVNQVIGYTGYGFDEDYELVEGDWIFEVWYQGRKLIDQKFTTYWPSEEESITLESALTPGKSAGMQAQSPEKPFSRLGWPRNIINMGETQDTIATESSSEF